jgi:hypothetical protein
MFITDWRNNKTQAMVSGILVYLTTLRNYKGYITRIIIVIYEKIEEDVG